LGVGHAEPVAARRARFFWALAAFVGACARAAFHENLATPFVERLAALAAGHEIPADAHARNASALAALAAGRASLARGPPLDVDAMPAGDPTPRTIDFRVDAFSRHLPELLDARAVVDHAVLRRVVLLQLQLLALARYLSTGPAAKLAFVVASPDFTSSHVSLYWLAELHLALAGLGLTLPTLASALRHLAPDHVESQFAYLMMHGNARRDLSAFKRLLLDLLPLLRSQPRDVATARRLLLTAHELTEAQGQDVEATLFFHGVAELLQMLLSETPAGSPRATPRASPRRRAPLDEDMHAKKLADATRAVERAHPPLPTVVDVAEAAQDLADLLANLVTWSIDLAYLPSTSSPRHPPTPRRSKSPKAPTTPAAPATPATPATPITPPAMPPATPAATRAQTPHSPVLSGFKPAR